MLVRCLEGGMQRVNAKADFAALDLALLERHTSWMGE